MGSTAGSDIQVISEPFSSFGAIPLTLNAYFAAAASLVMQFLAYRYRVGIEEEAMIATFGDTYRAYREKTYAFLPVSIEQRCAARCS